MSFNIRRAVIITGLLCVAWVVLTPMGLGGLVAVAGLVILGVGLYQFTQHLRAQEDADESSLPRWLRSGQNSESADEDEDEAHVRAAEERERFRREQDCGLTHDERLEFEQMIRKMKDHT